MSTSSFPTSIDTFVNPTATSPLDNPSLSFGQTIQNDALSALETKIGINNSLDTSSINYALATGWISISDTWTYSSAASPSFIVTVPSDATKKYSPGMRIMLTQSSSILYFLITAVTSTSITLYGGTNYTLTNSAISSIFYSSLKVPFGFPLNPDLFSISGGTASTSTTSVAWVNTGGSIIVPVGIWRVFYEGVAICSLNSLSAQSINMPFHITLSTTNNSASDTTWSENLQLGYGSGTTSMSSLTQPFHRERIQNILTTTTYYANSLADSAVTSSSGFNSISIKAISAYL